MRSAAGAIPRIAGLLVVLFVLVAGSAMLRTSTTFDEIVFPAVGARALQTGDYSMVNDHPRLPQVMYGLPLVLADVRYPPEDGVHWNWYTRYQYAEYLYWGVGNSGEKVTLLSRLVSLAFGALTVLATFLVARRQMPDGAALLAATLVALLPDMLAHSGIAYNDVPATFGMLVAVCSLDALARHPAPRRAVWAALAFAFTVSMKYTGLVLLPILALLVALEAFARGRDIAWGRALLRAAGVFAVVVYAAMVALYLGEWRLSEYTAGLAQISSTVLSEGRVAFLLGESRTGGWWYFFPVAFVLKTPMGLHVLAAIALFAAVLAARGVAWRGVAAHPLRGPAVALAVLLAVTLGSRLNIGMRHALPMLPFACILIAQGVSWAWARGRKAVRAIVVIAVAGLAVSTLRAYPFFISYLSEYTHGRALHETLVDSNTDWGQGLVALRAYMRDNGIDRVQLGYFGTAMPMGYGVEYAPMPSYLGLAEDSSGPLPRYAVVSATLLAGVYMSADPYAPLRKEKPVAVVGGSLYVFDTHTLKRR